MRFVIQRVKHAEVTIENKVHGKINDGLLVLCGIADTDTNEIADKMIKKLCGLRIFEDLEGKTNLSLADVNGQLMLISQFTLYADCKKGNRPSFIRAGKPDMASPMYDYLIEEAGKYVSDVQRGIFGADMKIELLNDGPFTVILDSEEICK
jgi:D-tyrosyl-tRNA(Tyr) deacylase